MTTTKLNYPFSPSSDSDLPSPSTSTSTSPASANTTPESMNSQLAMADINATSPPPHKSRAPGALRRSRAPPRNEQGQMYCDHVNCRGRIPTFKRVCEWNKHMDRHERPYKCNEAGCELNPGFTYSGGLLRHQREVHKMHLSTKQPLYCPFPNCNRSSGAGFTRRENLEEHKRRRHLEELSDPASNPDSKQPTSTSLPQEPPVKRRRISIGMEGHGQVQGHMVANEQSDVVNPESLVLSLRAEIRQRDDYIRKQAAEIVRLSNLIRALPPQTIYGAVKTRVPGSGVGIG